MPQVITNGPVAASIANATAGTAVTANVNCPTNTLLLGGGGRVTTSNGSNLQRVALQSSLPVDGDTWRATGVVISNLSGGQTMQVQAYVICTT